MKTRYLFLPALGAVALLVSILSLSPGNAVQAEPALPGGSTGDATVTAASIPFYDDFSTEKGWTNATAGDFSRDATNEWLSWYITRDRDEQYYMPIDRYSGDFRLEARFKVIDWNSNCNLYFGLADELTGAYNMPEEPTGLFVDVSYFGGFWPSQTTIRAYGSYSDTGRYIGEPRIDYATGQWYRVVFWGR